MKNVFYFFVAAILISILWLVKKLPRQFAISSLEKIAKFLAPILPRTKLAKENLQKTFPHKTTREINLLVKNMWGHIARTFGESVFLDSILASDDKIEIVDNGMYEKIKARKNGAILFTAHTGNWELIPLFGKKYNLTTAVLFRKPNNPYLAKYLMQSRFEFGRLIPAGLGAASALMNVLEKNGIIGLLVDQALDRGLTIDFLGRKASANPLIVKLAEKNNCDIFPIRCIRLPNNRFKIEIEKNIKIARDKNGNTDMQQSLSAIHRTIEKWVREYPEQWLWIHNRWKRR